MLLTFKLFESLKSDKDLISDIAKKHNYDVLEIELINDNNELDIKIKFNGESDGLDEYDKFIEELSSLLEERLMEIYTEETGHHFKIYLNEPISEKKDSIQTIFTKSYIINFLKSHGFELIKYSPILGEHSVLVEMSGDLSKYENMIDKLISLNYFEIKEVETIDPGKKMKIFIKD